MKKIASIPIGIVIILFTYTLSIGEGFRKYPYLQNVKTTEITICWKVDENGGTEQVSYGTGGILDTIVPYPGPHPDDDRLYQLTITGLSPNTSYSYLVTSGSEDAGGTFLTATDGNDSFSFAVYGDPQSEMGVSNQNHEDVVDLIMSKSPNFLICTGDLWYSNHGGDVDEFFTVERDLLSQIALFPALGNHEYWNSHSPGDYAQPERYKRYFVLPDDIEVFLPSGTTFDEDYYSFTYGNSHFLFVNNNTAEGAPDYRVGSDQYTAIQGDLQAAHDDPDIDHIFVIMHKPAHSNGQKHGCGSADGIDDPEISLDLGALFESFNVDIVFQGHEHNYERFQPVDTAHNEIWICDPPGDPVDPNHPCNVVNEGVTYVVSGGGGGSLSSVDDAPVMESGTTPELTSIISDDTHHHAVFVTVDGEEITVEVRGTDNSLMDQFTISKVPTDPITHTFIPPASTTVPQGGTLGPFQSSITNNTASYYPFYMVPQLSGPAGEWFVRFRRQLVVFPNATNLSHDIYIGVPPSAQVGTHYHLVNLYDSGMNWLLSDWFAFEVTAGSPKLQRSLHGQRLKKLMNVSGAHVIERNGWKITVVPGKSE